jgi:hypothetical protein
MCGRFVRGMNGSAMRPEVHATRQVATIGSILNFSSAFQPAWQAAAPRTAKNTNASIRRSVQVSSEIGTAERDEIFE